MPNLPPLHLSPPRWSLGVWGPPPLGPLLVLRPLLDAAGGFPPPGTLHDLCPVLLMRVGVHVLLAPSSSSSSMRRVGAHVLVAPSLIRLGNRNLLVLPTFLFRQTFFLTHRQTHTYTHTHTFLLFDIDNLLIK